MLIHFTIRITTEEPYMIADKTAIKVQIRLGDKSHVTNHPDDEAAEQTGPMIISLCQFKVIALASRI